MTRLIEDSILVPLINYLATRPYTEVYQVLPILQKLPELQEKPIMADKLEEVTP